MTIDFVRRLFGTERPTAPLLQIFTPSIVGANRPATRLLVGGITVAGLAVAGAVALSSLLTLMAALFALYFLLTEVLGLSLDVDPRAFVAEAQRYAAQARNN